MIARSSQGPCIYTCVARACAITQLEKFPYRSTQIPSKFSEGIRRCPRAIKILRCYRKSKGVDRHLCRRSHCT